MIKEDAQRYQIESEEKRQLKKNHQQDYKSYLDRQMDQHRLQELLRSTQVQEEAVLLKHRVQKMAEVEKEKMREAMRVRKEVTQENSHAHRSLNERQFRERVKEQSEERERAR